MKKSKSFLSGGVFDKHFMDSKVTTRSVTTKELVLGHVIGPLGLIMLINTIASLLEIYIMKQMSVAVGDDVTGDAYKNLGTVYYWVALGTRLAAMPMGLVTGYLMQHTKLDFEAENEKYLNKKGAKERRAKEKQDKVRKDRAM
jgi:GPH family glycoside/pentoside/hexuronide:cation symporter|nr:hypothetical protein [uncultured Acetatifactor sp.]